MLLQLLLRLRNQQERVKVILREGHTRPELGIAQPQEDDRRASLPELWGRESHPTRQEPLATIDEPLPVRTQTILSHEVPDNVRRALNGDVTDAVPASRRRGIDVDLKL